MTKTTTSASPTSSALPDKRERRLKRRRIRGEGGGGAGRAEGRGHVPLDARVALVRVEQAARVQLAAVVAGGGQLRYRLLDGEVTRAQRLGDLAATVGARGALVFEARVGEEMRQAAGAHQVAVVTLRGERAAGSVNAHQVATATLMEETRLVQ